MNKYEGIDNYCYKGTSVLINKKNIRTEKELEIVERKLTIINTMKIYENINIKNIKFTMSFYLGIHKTLFNELYKFAGKSRNIVLIKGNTRFCEPQYIDSNLRTIFEALKEENYLTGLNKEIFIKKIAYYYSELNAIHAFREGNGRTNRIFIDILSKFNDYELNIEKWAEKKQIEAMIDSMQGNNKKIERLITNNIKTKQGV